MEHHRYAKNARSSRFSTLEVSNLGAKEHLTVHHRCAINARSLRFSPLEVCNLGTKEHLMEHHRCAMNARSLRFSPLEVCRVFCRSGPFLTHWGPWKRTSCTIGLVVEKPRHKRRKPALRGKERHAVESLKRDDNKEMCECQSTMQHSQVGESAANGAIENAIQRVQRPGQSNRTGCGVKHQGEAHPICF